MIHRVKGMQDLLDLTLYNAMVASIKKHMATYCYREISTPIIEATELFQRTLGAETDVVSKEMFLIKTADDEKSLCLRPENTASIARAFIENKIQQLPWKVFTCGAMFRHERPQQGRFRQFSQCSIEIIGSGAIAHDAELIIMLDRFFAEVLTLPCYALQLNFLGCQADREHYKEIVHTFIAHHKSHICALCTHRAQKNILRIFDCKNAQCAALYRECQPPTNFLCNACDHEWQQLQKLLELLSITFVHQPTLVRGLDYYSKTVFEFVSANLGAQNAFCGGGRYDRLLKELGAASDLPCVGAAIGLERLQLLLEQSNTLQGESAPALHVIIPLTPAQETLALLLADELRARNKATEVLLGASSLKSAMRKAGSAHAAFALLLGEDEQRNGTVTLKNMANGIQETVAQSEAVARLTR